MSPHRVPLLDSLRRHPDPAHSSDPHLRSVVAALRQLEVAPAPGAQFRDELRAQLVAVAPRLVAESAPADATDDAARARATHARTARAGSAVTAPRHATVAVATHAPRTHRSFARPLTVTGSVVLVLALLLAGATWLSQNSLPGGALYGLKRASENVRIAFASNSTNAANDRLRLATKRVDEARRLVHKASAEAVGTRPQAGGGVNAHTAALVADTLASADNDVLTASRQLNKTALSHDSGRPLSTMIGWAPGQLGRLSALRAALPSTALRNRATSSWHVVDTALGRATAIRSLAGCACMRGAHSDRFGPLPCTSCSANTTSPGARPAGTSRSSAPHRSHQGAPTGSTHPHRPASGGTAGVSGASGRHGASPAQPTPPPAPTDSTTPAAPGSNSTPSGSTTPHPPLGVDSCGLHISLGPLNLNLGSCPTSHS